MPYEVYNFIHIASVILLVGFTFYAFASPSSKSKKVVLSVTGICSLLVFVSGFGMQPQWGWPGWFWLKLVSWLAISAFSGIAYRRRNLSGVFMLITVVLVVLASWLVIYKPF